MSENFPGPSEEGSTAQASHVPDSGAGSEETEMYRMHVTANALSFVKDVTSFVGPKQSTMCGRSEKPVDSEPSVHVMGQTNNDPMYRILFGFHRCQRPDLAQICVLAYNGDKEFAEKRVDEHELWMDIIRAAINQDREHVWLVVRKLCNIPSHRLTLILNDSSISQDVIIKKMCEYTEHCPLIVVLNMYFEILNQYRIERVYADVIGVHLDESVMAARLNCAKKTVQVFPHNLNYGVSSIMNPDIPEMELANENLNYDHLFEILMKYLRVLMYRGLKDNKVKLPETVRNEFLPIMEELLRKALRKSRPFVYQNVAEYVGLNGDKFARDLLKHPTSVINRMYAKTVKSSGPGFKMFDRITQVPEELVDPEYVSSTDTSVYDTDCDKFIENWYVNDAYQEKMTSEREIQKNRKDENIPELESDGVPPSAAKPKQKIKTKKKGEGRKLEEHKSGTQSDDDADAQIAAKFEEVERKLKELKLREEAAERREEASDRLEGSLYERCVKMDEKEDELKRKLKQLQDDNKTLAQDRIRMEEEFEKKNVEAVKNAEANLDRQQKLIYARLGKITEDQASLNAVRAELRNQGQELQQKSVALEAERAQLHHDREQFDKFQENEELVLRIKERNLANERNKLAGDFCDRFAQLAGGLERPVVPQERAEEIGQQAPQSNRESERARTCPPDCTCNKGRENRSVARSDDGRESCAGESNIEQPDTMPVWEKNVAKK